MSLRLGPIGAGAPVNLAKPKPEDLDDEPTCSVLECTECGEGFTALRALLGQETYGSIKSKDIAGQPIKFAATIDTLGPRNEARGSSLSTGSGVPAESSYWNQFKDPTSHVAVSISRDASMEPTAPPAAPVTISGIEWAAHISRRHQEVYGADR